MVTAPQKRRGRKASKNGTPTEAPPPAATDQTTPAAETIAQQAAVEPLAQPATATPPANGHHQPELWPAANGVMRIWMCCRDDRGNTEAYRLSLAHLGKTGEKGWALQKASNGTVYHLLEVWNAATQEREMSCDCPGATAHGLQCNGGKGCKHVRALRALRALAEENGI